MRIDVDTPNCEIRTDGYELFMWLYLVLYINPNNLYKKNLFEIKF